MIKEIKVESAFQFFEIAYDIRNSRRTNEHSTCIEFYRGHADKSYRLNPTINRYYMLDFERDLIDEFRRTKPDEFPDSLGMFDCVAKMQHYNLHTRLLDITESPAVALYFACSEFNSGNDIRDGEVLLFPAYLDDIVNNKIANMLMEFYINMLNSSMDVTKAMELANVSSEDVKAFLFYLYNHSNIARPRIISERMKRQLGAFLLCGNAVHPRSGCRNERCNKRSSCLGQTNDISMLSIPKKLKILTIGKSIRDITDEHIERSQEDIRYIINRSSKQRILDELDTLGINEAYLFPELQNEGKRIMKEYLTRTNRLE